MPREKAEFIHMRIEPALKKAAERAAKADRRSLTTYIEKLIENDLHKTGQTIGKPARKRK